MSEKRHQFIEEACILLAQEGEEEECKEKIRTLLPGEQALLREAAARLRGWIIDVQGEAMT